MWMESTIWLKFMPERVLLGSSALGKKDQKNLKGMIL